MTTTLPLPHTPTLGDRLTATAGTGARLAWSAPTGAAHWIARTVASRPGAAVALGLGAVTATPVTWSHVTGGVIAEAVVLVSTAESRARLSSVVDLSRFHKRRRMIKRRWVTVCSDVGLAKPGKTTQAAKRVPRIRKVEPTAVGLRMHVAGGSVASPAGIADKGDRLRAALGARHIDVRPDPDRPGITLLDLVYADPFRTPFRTHQLPAGQGLHVVTGFDSWGRPVARDLRLPTLLVGGKGSGKSSEAWTILWALDRLGIPYRVRVFDPKGGMEFSDLAGAAYVYESDATRWKEFLEDLLGAMTVRMEVLAKRGIRKLGPGDFTVENPFDLTIIDELLTVAAFSNQKDKIRYRDRQISTEDAWTKVFLSQCRAAGFSAVALSQLSQKSGAGDMRDMFDYTTVLRVSSDDIVRAAGLDPKVAPAHDIPAGERFSGIGYQVTDLGVVKYRAAYLNDRERAAVARNVARATALIGGPKA